MKIGYFCNMTNWSHKPYNVLIDEVREIAMHCDQSGWDSIWFTEHHLNHEGMDACPNPLLFSADIAAKNVLDFADRNIGAVIQKTLQRIMMCDRKHSAPAANRRTERARK